MSSAITRGLAGMETLVPVGDVELCVDTVGAPADIPLLLIGTTVATWDDELVERLTGRFVIRYDLRDTGRSTTVDPDSRSQCCSAFEMRLLPVGTAGFEPATP
jgi:hypothetical protein